MSFPLFLLFEYAQGSVSLFFFSSRRRHTRWPRDWSFRRVLFRSPDSRVRDRIFHLKEDEIGYLKINNLKQDGKSAEGKTVGTIYQVKLPKAILPGEKTTLTLDFEGQVPVQIRRAGRNNAEGIALSMSQWYPKLAEYDFEGWHADPYIAREFHGVWGDFDVKLTIDKDFTVGGTGYLQNPEEIGHGYQKNLKIGRASC